MDVIFLCVAINSGKLVGCILNCCNLRRMAEKVLFGVYTFSSSAKK